RNVGIPGCQRRGSCYRGLIGSGRTHAAQEDQRCSEGENHRRRDPSSWKAKSRHSWPPSGAPARMDVYETYVYTPSQAVTFGSGNPYPRNRMSATRDTSSKAETAGTGNWKRRRFAGNAVAWTERSRLLHRSAACLRSVRVQGDNHPSPRLFTKENIRSDSYIRPKTAMRSRAIDRPWQTSGSSSDSSHSSGQSRVSSRSRSWRSREWTRTSGEHGCSSWKNESSSSSVRSPSRSSR